MFTRPHSNRSRRFPFINLGYIFSFFTGSVKKLKTKNVSKVYEGETSRSIRVRSSEHLAAFKNQKQDSVLYKHKKLEHVDEEVEFGLEVTGLFKDALTRQANESVRIYNRRGTAVMNSKSEFNHPPTARVVVEKKKNYEFKPNQAGVRNSKQNI